MAQERAIQVLICEEALEARDPSVYLFRRRQKLAIPVFFVLHHCPSRHCTNTIF
jgi:hypothetical protein